MFYFFVLLYSASSVYSLNFTVDGVLKFGPKLMYNYNVAVPSENEEGSRNNHPALRQRDVTAGDKDDDALESRLDRRDALDAPSNLRDASEDPPDRRDALEDPSDPREASEGPTDKREASEGIETRTKDVTAEKIHSVVEYSNEHESPEENYKPELRGKIHKNKYEQSSDDGEESYNHELRSKNHDISRDSDLKKDSEVYDSSDNDRQRFTKPIMIEPQRKPNVHNKHERKRKEKRYIDKKYDKRNRHRNKNNDDYGELKKNKRKRKKKNDLNGTGVYIGNWDDIPDSQKKVIKFKNATHSQITIVITGDGTNSKNNPPKSRTYFTFPTFSMSNFPTFTTRTFSMARFSSFGFKQTPNPASHGIRQKDQAALVIDGWDDIPDDQKRVVSFKNETHNVISLVVDNSKNKGKKRKITGKGKYKQPYRHDSFYISDGSETDIYPSVYSPKFAPNYVRQMNETGFAIHNWDDIPINQKRVEKFENGTHRMVKVIIDDTNNPVKNPEFPTFVTPKGIVNTFQNNTHRIISVVDDNTGNQPGFPNLLPLIIPQGMQTLKNKTLGAINKNKGKIMNKTGKIVSSVVGKIKQKRNTTKKKIKTTRRKKPHTKKHRHIHRYKENRHNMVNFESDQRWKGERHYTRNDAVNKSENSGWIDKLRNTTHKGFFENIQQQIVNKTSELIKPHIEEAWNESVNIVQQVGNDINYQVNEFTTNLTIPANPLDPIKNPLEIIKDEAQVGLENLYNELNQMPLRISDNSTIYSFTKRILNRTLNLFKHMELRSKERGWKKRMKHLAKSYEEKFNEYLRTTKHHTIRTRLGTRKVILNAIDVSNRIVKRLLDFTSDVMDKKGLANNNLTPVLFRTEITKEEGKELNYACNQLGICRSQKALTDFIVDILVMMLSIPNDKFKTAFSAIIEAARNTDFAFSETVNDGINSNLDYYERQDVHVQKGMLMIVKNIIANRNAPLVLYKDSNPIKSRLPATLAFLDIINTLDEKVPTYEDDIQAWDDIRRKMRDYVDGKNDNIANILKMFMVRLANAIKDVDYATWQLITRNINILFT